jgi:hypothetical protein
MGWVGEEKSLFVAPYNQMAMKPLICTPNHNPTTNSYPFLEKETKLDEPWSRSKPVSPILLYMTG